jgi:phosphoribosylpyrophosphate synthetase
MYRSLLLLLYPIIFLPRNVYVQFSIITIIVNIHASQERFCTDFLITIKANIHASQERLCTVLSYYHYSQYNTSFPGTFMYSSILLKGV